MDLDAKKRILMKISMGKGRRREMELTVGGGKEEEVGRGEGGEG